MITSRQTRRLLASAALAALCAAISVPAAAQQASDPERVERIYNSLKPNPNAAADHANRIIQMEINTDDGYVDVTLDYNYSIDLAVFYEFDSAELTPETKLLLSDLGFALRKPELAGLTFLIAGHTDAKGSKPYNQSLSERRALEARRFLVQAFGIPPSQLFAVGFGEERLADRARPLDGINRRVEITLIKAVGYESRVGTRTPGPSADAGASPVAPPAPGQPTQVAGPLPDCDGVSGGAQAVPPATGLDDFGGRRTELPCAPKAEDTAAVPPVPPQPTTAAGNANDAINN